jgi:hypothetical protein
MVIKRNRKPVENQPTLGIYFTHYIINIIVFFSSSAQKPGYFPSLMMVLYLLQKSRNSASGTNTSNPRKKPMIRKMDFLGHSGIVGSDGPATKRRVLV